MPPQKKPQASAGSPLPELQTFSDVRKRPAVFLFLQESIRLTHVVKLRNCLGAKSFEELDLVIDSAGGNIHAAYQLVELLRLHTKRLNACVPFVAKSAATLLCVGADTVFLDELAQLGPLDTQIYEEKKAGKGEFTSALNPFKTLEQLQKFSLETLDIAMKMIATRSEMDLEACLKHAIEFVRVTTGPLFTQLNSEKLGEYSRALSVGTEYADRLLRRFSSWDEEKRVDILERLVHGYPSHEYIIDYHELRELGFDVRLFDDAERPAVQGLMKYILGDRSIIECVLPSPTIEAVAPPTPKEGVRE